MTRKHWPIGPSSLARALVCPGSIRPNHENSSTNRYAEEGTAAHALLENWLLGTAPPTDTDPEMELAVSFAYTFIEDLRHDCDLEGVEYTVEHRPFHNFGGTCDYWRIKDRNLSIVDYKHGAGVTVEAEGNRQLMAYAVLILNWLKTEGPNDEVIDSVTGYIVQPRGRGEPIKTAEFTRKELAELEYLIGDLHELYEQRKDVDRKAGDHCQWCAAAADCPAIYQIAQDAADQAFTDQSGIDPAELAKWLDQAPILETFLKAIRERATAELEAGREVPGYKLVERIANRRWKYDEAGILRRLKKWGFGKRLVTTSVLLSPAQMEKAGVPTDAIQPLVERPVTGYALTKDKDLRPAVVAQSAENTFHDLSFLL